MVCTYLAGVARPFSSLKKARKERKKEKIKYRKKVGGRPPPATPANAFLSGPATPFPKTTSKLFNLTSFQFEKIIVPMHVVTQKHLNEAATEYPDAAKEIAAWYQVVKATRWASFEEVKRTFTDADAVDGYVIFNIRRNRYRLVTIIHYARERNGKPTMGHVYIRSFLTHRQYDNPANWDKEFGK